MKQHRQLWEHSPAIKQLLSELQDATNSCDEARLIIVSDEEGTMTFSGADACKVLASTDSVDLLCVALDNATGELMAEISGFEPQDAVYEHLEELFGYVELL